MDGTGSLSVVCSRKLYAEPMRLNGADDTRVMDARPWEKDGGHKAQANPHRERKHICLPESGLFHLAQ